MSPISDHAIHAVTSAFGYSGKHTDSGQLVAVERNDVGRLMDVLTYVTCFVLAICACGWRSAADYHDKLDDLLVRNGKKWQERQAGVRYAAAQRGLAIPCRGRRVVETRLGV